MSYWELLVTSELGDYFINSPCTLTVHSRMVLPYIAYKTIDDSFAEILPIDLSVYLAYIYDIGSRMLQPVINTPIYYIFLMQQYA